MISTDGHRTELSENVRFEVIVDTGIDQKKVYTDDAVYPNKTNLLFLNKISLKYKSVPFNLKIIYRLRILYVDDYKKGSYVKGKVITYDNHMNELYVGTTSGNKIVKIGGASYLEGSVVIPIKSAAMIPSSIEFDLHYHIIEISKLFLFSAEEVRDFNVKASLPISLSPAAPTSGTSQSGSGGTGIDQEKIECTVDYMVQKVVDYYAPGGAGAKYVIYYDGGDYRKPVIDVTKVVKKVYPTTQYARLELFLYPEKCSYKGPYDKPPKSRSPEEIVKGWQAGYEMQRIKCGNKYYWLIIPCKLYIKVVYEQNITEKTDLKSVFRDLILDAYKNGALKDEVTGYKGNIIYIGYGAKKDIVTKCVQTRYPTKAAYLKLYLDNPDNLEYSDPYKTLPKINCDVYLKSWLGHSHPVIVTYNKMYYIVYIPADLYVYIDNLGKYVMIDSKNVSKYFNQSAPKGTHQLPTYPRGQEGNIPNELPVENEKLPPILTTLFKIKPFHTPIIGGNDYRIVVKDIETGEVLLDKVFSQFNEVVQDLGKVVKGVEVSITYPYLFIFKKTDKFTLKPGEYGLIGTKLGVGVEYKYDFEE